MPKKWIVFLSLAVAAVAGYLSLRTVYGASSKRPLYYTREVTDEDLSGRSLRDLALMRNTIYARAGNPFRKKWLNDYFSSQSWYSPLPQMDMKKLTKIDLRNADLIADFDVRLTRDDLLKLQKTIPASRSAEDLIELRLLSMRLGTWLGPDDPTRTPLEDPGLLDKQIALTQLDDFSRRDLRLLRNMIYARRGRPFKSELLQTYYANMNWYKADPGYSEARLTATDHRNINLIRSLEDQLGGPLTDGQHLQEEGWYANA